MKSSALLFTLIVALAACGGASEPAAETTPATPETTTGGETTSGGETTTGGTASGEVSPELVAHGADLFARKCGTCHGDDASGDTAPDLHNIHFTSERMHSQIRNGSDRMRPISETRLSEPELLAVTAWLHTIGAVD